MLITEILKEFYEPRGYFPQPAVDAAIANKEEVVPHLLDILDFVVNNPEAVNPERMDYIFAFNVLAYLKEQAAYPYVLKAANLPDELCEELLGDFTTENLARWMVSTFDGDLNAIKMLVKNAEANVWARSAALDSFLGLFAINEISREEVIAYYKEVLLSSCTQEDQLFTAMLISNICDIYGKELYPEIKQAFDEGKVDEDYIGLDFVDEAFAGDIETCLTENVYGYKYHLPIMSVEEEMAAMPCFRRSLEDDEEWEPEFVYTLVSSTPKIGRNELCPCESGKKYKKCCLEAERL